MSKPSTLARGLLAAVLSLAAASCGGASDLENPLDLPHQANADVDWRDQVIYQIVVDRFANGDPNNDINVAPTIPGRYHGGDWQGVIDRLDYLEQLGVTALWISPVVKNTESDAGFASYHGYWTQDFLRPNPHFGDLYKLGDWMYESEDHIYGGFTVDAVRAQMAAAERRDHDAAWDLPFGKPGRVLVDRLADPDAEHPMSENIAPTYRKQLASDRALLARTDERGWTLLHELALAGSAANVQTLLELGADRSARTPHGMTARDLALSLGWKRVVALIDYIEPLVRR